MDRTRRNSEMKSLPNEPADAYHAPPSREGSGGNT